MDVKALIDNLAECLCAEVNADDSLCFCGVLVGTAPYDVSGECSDQKCGQAWVRLVLSYPASEVGVADTTIGNCGKGLGLDLELGVMRCFPISEEPPTEAELLAVSDKQIEDMLGMRRAITCCFADEEEDIGYVMGEYTPVGPEGEGGQVGGVWLISVAE